MPTGFYFHKTWSEERKKQHSLMALSNHYGKWMKVFTRDNFKCKMCESKVKLQAHHILPWRDYPELRFDVNNGITLCQAHHPRKRAEEAKLSPYFKQLVAETTSY